MSNTVIATIGKSRYTTKISAGDHQLIADEPIPIGGDNLGPTPYDYLLSALGACTVITMQMYAKRKGWEVDQISVNLSHNKEYENDCENCDDKGALIDRIYRKIEITSKLDANQIKKLMIISDKCPVHKTLSSTTKISTELL